MAETRVNQIVKRIETAANIAIILAAVAIVIAITANHLRQPPHISTIAEGSRLPLRNATWRSSEKTFVLAISTTCHFCAESVGFYREVLFECKQQHVRTIAILPQSTEEAEAYLKSVGVAVDEVRQVALSDLQIGGTPTLLLVDKTGIVRSVWFGKLATDREKQVLKSLGS